MVRFSDANRLWRSDHCIHIMDPTIERADMGIISAVVLLAAAAAGAPQPQGNTASASIRQDYRTVRGYVLRSAEKMPADKYTFRPTPEVRTFAQQIAHIADDQYNLCAPARGDTRPAAYQAIERSTSTKPALIDALTKAFAYCDAAYDALTDASGAEPASNTDRTRFGMLNWNLWHTWEHYGNIVVYLRINNLVPPSSEPQQSKGADPAARRGP
jgi:uncharacterized damage-inducible protein DinB